MDGLAIQRNNILFLKRVLTLFEEGFLTFLGKPSASNAINTV